MLALPISKSRIKALSFYQNSPKIKLFLQKNAKSLSAGSPPPDPRASGGFDPDPICLQQLGAPPPDSQISPPIANF